MTRAGLAGVTAVAALLGAGVTWAVDRAAPGALPLGDQARFDAAVRATLDAHPELINEALGKLQDRQTARLIEANRGAIVTPVASAWAGNPKGDVTLVEYYDYNCGYCRASLPIIDQLLASDPKLKIVYRDLPVLSPLSDTAARYSLAAARAGKFQPFHDALYKAGPVSDTTIAAAAAAAGLSVARLKAEADSPQTDADIRLNLSMMRPLGLSGTPSWVIGDKVLVGAQSMDALRAAIAAARKS